jgi:peptidase A4-like protein
MHLRRRVLAVAFAALAAPALALASTAASHAASGPPVPFTHQPMTGAVLPAVPPPPGTVTSVTTTNWAGYAATGQTFTKASATFSDPSVNCTTTPNAFSYHWVGLDGFNNGTVEQDGVASFCYQGVTYYWAWYELYPQSPVTAFNINPGDAVNASVTYAGSGNYTLKLTDVTSGQSFSVKKPCGATSCANASAEVISEGYPSAPYTGTADYGIEPYVNIAFTDALGHTGGVTDSTWASWKITEQGTVVDAVPSSLWGGKAFDNTWKAVS